MPPASRLRHFPGLHGLRFFAAITVLVQHVEQLKQLRGLPSALDGPAPIVRKMGMLAVTFFFVLSGFLITYLLLDEKRRTRRIRVVPFYLRRVFRIWPLYYAVVLVGLFLLPNFDCFRVPTWGTPEEAGFGHEVLLYLVMLPNLVTSFFLPFPGVAQTWSIGVEEQFYLFWPHLLRLPKRFLPYVFAALLALFLALPPLIGRLRPLYPEHEVGLAAAQFAFMQLRFGCMAIGGFTAWLVFDKQKTALALLCSLPVQLAGYLGLLALLLLPEGGPYTLQNGDNELYSLFFAVIILNVATNPRTFLKLRHPWLEYLGSISYGIYMLHIPLVAAITYAAARLHEDGWLPGWTLEAAVWSASLVATLALTSASYRWFEKPFLRLKPSS